MRSLEAKVVVLGSQGVGKTSVVVRYVSNTFNKHASPTIGASFFTCKMMLDNYRLKLQVWDTAGQERFRSMAPMYYRKANAALLTYDITSLDSFDDMKSWVKELQKNVEGNVAMCVLGNKCDLEAERQVPVAQAQQFASSVGAEHFDTSALSSQGVEEAFVHLARCLIAMYESHDEDHQDSGLSSYQSYSSPSGDRVTVRTENTETNFPGNLHNTPEEEKPRRGCCS